MLSSRGVRCLNIGIKRVLKRWYACGGALVEEFYDEVGALVE